ncbi:transposase [Bradyrhizobium sp. 23AC]
MLDHTLRSDVTARRLEVITETGRRLWFSKDDKARIVEETRVPGAVVSEIARRHGLSPQQVFTWRAQDSATQGQAGCSGSPLRCRGHRDRSRGRHDPGSAEARTWR